jgi:hypothetical protein
MKLSHQLKSCRLAKLLLSGKACKDCILKEEYFYSNNHSEFYCVPKKQTIELSDICEDWVDRIV